MDAVESLRPPHRRTHCALDAGTKAVNFPGACPQRSCQHSLLLRGDLELFYLVLQGGGGGMGMTCHVMEECFNQHLFISSQESERCLGLPRSIVQKTNPNPTMLSSERCRTFFWEPNAPADKGCSSITRLAPAHPPSRALRWGLMTTKGAPCTHSLQVSHRKTHGHSCGPGCPHTAFTELCRVTVERGPFPQSCPTPETQKGTHSPEKRPSPQTLQRPPPACATATN